eukprot:357016-Chlamydomonas_euryale.AAC.1
MDGWVDEQREDWSAEEVKGERRTALAVFPGRRPGWSKQATRLEHDFGLCCIHLTTLGNPLSLVLCNDPATRTMIHRP